MNSWSIVDRRSLLLLAALIGAVPACGGEEAGSSSDDLTWAPEIGIKFPRSTFDNLDHGITWFGPDESYQKAVTGETNPYFDPKKPTVIHVHGWQNGSTKLQQREAFNYGASGSPDLYLADIWIDAGWNVGMMYWNQFADEGKVADAEAKIYTTGGPQKMRWMNASGVHSNGPAKPAGELFYDAYAAAMADYEGDTIRITGHSLGNQMAIEVTRRISNGIAAGELPARLLPKRVTLLDPAYTSGGRSYLGGAWPGEIARASVTALAQKGVVFEAYRSSALSTGIGPLVDKNEALMKQVALSDIKPDYFGGNAIAQRHSAAVWNYFWSLSFSPPSVKGSEERAPSASLPDSGIGAWMTSPRRLVQTEGTRSKTPEDNVMALQNK